MGKKILRNVMAFAMVIILTFTPTFSAKADYTQTYEATIGEPLHMSLNELFDIDVTNGDYGIEYSQPGNAHLYYDQALLDEVEYGNALYAETDDLYFLANSIGDYSFNFVIDGTSYDGEENHTGDTVRVHVSGSSNTAPTLSKNTGMTVAKGCSDENITASMLEATDDEQEASYLIYTLIAATAHGTLYKDGTALSSTNSLTQADINNGLLTYSNDGSTSTADSFKFTVSDGSGGSISESTFSITVDGTPPTLSSAERDSDTQITLTLSEDCDNLTSGGFTATKVGDSTTYSVTSVEEGDDASHVVLTVADMGTAAGSGIKVTYSAVSGTIADIVGNALATDSTGKTISAWDTTAPTVLSIDRDALATEITNATSVTYRVTFSEGVTSVDKDDFTLTKTGTADGTVNTVSEVSATVYDVTINSVSGSGTLRLDLNSSLTGIKDIGGTAIAAGYTSGETYTIDNTAPTLSNAVRDSDTQITLTMSEDCEGISSDGFIVTKAGALTTYSVTSAEYGADESHVVLTVADMGTAAGKGITVTYSSMSGVITDIVGNALETDSTGKTISAWDTTAPTVLSINRDASASEITNADSVTYRVTFSEGVTGVDKDDFTLTKTGTADGIVNSVSEVSTTEYDVTINNISGSGTLRLDLNSSLTGIADIGGTEIATGYTSGETYTIDNTAPIILSAVRDSDTQITLTLSENCENITSGGFTVTKVGNPTTYNVTSAVEGADESHVVLTVADMGTAAGSGITVTYSTASGTITDMVGNALATESIGKTISAWDTVAPIVLTTNRDASASEITNATSVTFTVRFSEDVTGVDKDDFTLTTTTGNASGAVLSVSAINGVYYNVTVSSITGSGAIRLDLNSALAGIADIGGTAIATGYTSGETYTIDNTAPIISGAVRDSDTQITITLSEDCEDISSDGFIVTKAGTLTTYGVTSAVKGSDKSHVVLTVDDMGTAAGSGVTVTYSALSGTVTDTVGNALATDDTGKTISAWDTTAPTVLSINRDVSASEITNADSVTYRVTFSEGVTGVDKDDFTLTKTVTADGTVNSVSSVSTTEYDVTVNSISGSGTLRLDLNSALTSIADIGGTAIATGYTSGETYTIDNTAPIISSGVRDSDTQITLTLSEDCENINSGGFTVTKAGALTTYSVTSAVEGVDDSHVVLTVADMGTAAGSGVTITYSALSGTITDTVGNALATDDTGKTISAWDTTAPTVLSINREASASEITNADGVTYRITFSEGVTGVDKDDFTLTKTGTADGTVNSVSTVSTTEYDVTVNNISGSGTLRLDLNSTLTGIVDIGGTAIATGYTSGQTYTIDNTAPIISSGVRDSDTQITLTLSENCENITSDGFTVTKVGNPTTYGVTSAVEGADESHVVLTVDDMGTAAGSGVTVTYSALSGTVTDTVGNVLATDGTGKTISAWDTTAPTVLSINRDASASEITNADIATYRITFSEGVTGVDKEDFTLTTTGTAEGTVNSVSTVSTTEYDVTINNISGSGTLRLDLNSSLTGIADIGGTAIETGYTSGETYTIDNTAPIISSGVRDSDTQITLTLSEDCENITSDGFTVTKVGNPATYSVTSAVKGADESHVVLTVDDMGTAAGSGITVTYSAASGTITDTVGNALETDSTGKTITAWDTVAPIISSASLGSGNGYIDITFSKGVFGSSDATTALTADKLALTYIKNGADEAEVVVSSLKDTDSVTEASASSLSGGETTVRVFLGITGTPSGVETVAIAPASASSIYDKAGNAMESAQMTEAMTLEDQSAPKVGESGAITASDVTVSAVKLSWAAAADRLTTQTNLQYKVVYSTSNNISTAADAENFGTLAKDWTANISDTTVTELTGSTIYYFNVLVKDAVGNVSAYNPVSQATAYTVTYKNNYSDSDATVYYSQTAVSGSKIFAPTQPARSGYMFDGWYTERTYTTAWNFKNNTVTNDTILYAKWVPIPTFTVTYDGNGADIGSVPVDSNAYELGSAVKVKSNTGSLAKAGYTFDGWKSSLNETVYTPGQTFTILGGVTLSAVWTAVPATYTVTYNNNYSGSGAYTSQTAIASGSTLTAPSEPSRIGYLFIGWYKDALCANRWNFSTDTVAANTNLYAKWTENTYTVSGKVEDDQGTHTAVSNATVKVMQGNIQFGDTVTTDSSGSFTVTGVPDGTYNLVVTKDNQKVTTCIKVSGGNFICEGSIILPMGYRNSTLDVIGSETPNVVVDGLNDVFGDPNVYDSSDEGNVNAGGTVEIKLTVQQNDNSTNKATVEASMKSNGYTGGTVLDVDLTKISTTNNGASQESSISAIDDTIKIIIPLPVELQGKDNYVVYRAHDYGSGVVVDTITTRAKNGEYIEISSDKTQITAYLKYFSTYAIAYKKNSTSTSDSSGYSLGSTRSYEIASSADLGGSISPSGNITVKEGMSKTYTITADEGYCVSDVLVDGESVGAVNSYTFSDVKADHKISAEFERRETSALPYYSDNGKAVFIGFATDAGGEMRYIAPDGATVLFEQNPKSFTDTAGHWAKNSIDFATERELFFGTGGSDFSPQSGMTRAMFATVIGRLYERSYGKIANSDAHTFTDVDYDAYYGNYIEWASENSIITGIGGGQFKPSREITRQEMAAILYRFDKFLNASHTDLAGTQLNYSDAADISSWATEAALYCQQTGIITGRSNGNFVPQGMATRAEVAAILQRFIENTVK